MTRALILQMLLFGLALATFILFLIWLRMVYTTWGE